MPCRYVAYLLRRPALPLAAAIRIASFVSLAFQSAVVYIFPAICWRYGAGVFFSAFVSVLFWGPPAMSAFDWAADVAITAAPRIITKPTREQLERAGHQCSICWTPLGEFTAEDGPGTSLGTRVGSSGACPAEPECRHGSAEHAGPDAAQRSPAPGPDARAGAAPPRAVWRAHWDDGRRAAPSATVRGVRDADTQTDAPIRRHVASQTDEAEATGPAAQQAQPRRRLFGLLRPSQEGGARSSSEPIAGIEATPDQDVAAPQRGEDGAASGVPVGATLHTGALLSVAACRDDMAVTLECGQHCFHFRCIAHWLQQCTVAVRATACPLCQQAVAVDVRLSPSRLFSWRRAPPARAAEDEWVRLLIRLPVWRSLGPPPRARSARQCLIQRLRLWQRTWPRHFQPARCCQPHCCAIAGGPRP